MMSDLISRQTLSDAMYHEAFETDTDMQQWNSGCWIRYKLFENVLRGIPSADAVEVVRCKDCEHNDHGRCEMWEYLKVSETGFCHEGARMKGIAQ